MKAKTNLRTSLCLLLCFVLCLSVVPLAVLATSERAKDSSVSVFADYGKGFELLSRLYFGDSVTEQTVAVKRQIRALRIVKGECYELNIDRLTLDGVCPEGYGRKLSATDNDLIEIEDSADFELCGKGELIIAARSPVELKGEDYSFTFPVTNRGRIRATSDFYTYSLGSNKGSFSDADVLSVPDSSFLFKSEMCYPDSGHPDAPMDFYVADDGTTLYVFFEAFLDNTFDHGKDFAGVHVKCGDKVRTYKIHTTEENEYGRWWFCYTDSSETYNWEHMCYLAEIPLSELDAADGTLSLAFEYYGTAYRSEELERLCIGDLFLVNQAYADLEAEYPPSDGKRTYDALLPAAGKTMYEPGKGAKDATWWLTNTGTSKKSAYTLTLRNANITRTHSGYPDRAFLFIYGNLTIELVKGTTNNIGTQILGAPDSGMDVQGQETVITGAGTLNLYSPGSPIASYCSITVKDGATVNAFKNGMSQEAEYYYNDTFAVWVEENLTIDNAELNVEVFDDLKEVYGIRVFYGELIMTGNSTLTSAVTGTSVKKIALGVDTLNLKGDVISISEGDFSPGTKVSSLTLEQVNESLNVSKPYVGIHVEGASDSNVPVIVAIVYAVIFVGAIVVGFIIFDKKKAIV